MPIDSVTKPNQVDRTILLERTISRRTHGRIHDLKVEKQVQPEKADTQVFQVTGLAGSYHVRQLAIAACGEYFDGSNPSEITIDDQIQVRSNRPRRP